MAKRWNYNDKTRYLSGQLPIQQQHEYNKLIRFLRNRYSYVIVDEEQRKQYRNNLPFAYLERLIVEYGRAAVYEDDTVGLAIYKPVMSGDRDIFGRPKSYILHTANGSKMTTVKADDPKLIIVSDTFDHYAYSNIAYRYGLMLGKIIETINTNIAAMRTPFIVAAPKEKMLEVRMILEAFNEKPEVLLDSSIGLDEEVIKVIKLEVPDNLKSLEDQYNTRMSKFMEEIGFSSNSIDKKERLVAAEAEDDDDILKVYDSEPYQARKEFVELMEEKLGIKLQLIKANDDLYIEIKPKVQDNGQ